MSGATVPGTFQHYIVSFLRYVTLIPEALDMAEAAPVLCKVQATQHSGLRRLIPDSYP